MSSFTGSESGIEPAADEVDTTGLVWHYTDAQGLLSIVRNHVLWATASGFLNDHQEVELGRQRLKAALDDRADEGNEAAEVLRDRLKRTGEADRGPSPSTFFILSAAAHWDLLAMWRCYGGIAESYAIGLDMHQPLPVLADAGTTENARLRGILRTRSWTPVAYSDAEQHALANRAVDMLPNIADVRRMLEVKGNRETLVKQLSPALDELEQALVLVKHAGFIDEREVRHTVSLLRSPEDHGWDGILRYRASRYGVAPYLWLTGGHPDSGEITEESAPLPIKAVAISPSPNGPAAAESLQAMLLAQGYDVPVLRSDVPFR